MKPEFRSALAAELLSISDLIHSERFVPPMAAAPLMLAARELTEPVGYHPLLQPCAVGGWHRLSADPSSDNCIKCGREVGRQWAADQGGPQPTDLGLVQSAAKAKPTKAKPAKPGKPPCPQNTRGRHNYVADVGGGKVCACGAVKGKPAFAGSVPSKPAAAADLPGVSP